MSENGEYPGEAEVTVIPPNLPYPGMVRIQIQGFDGNLDTTVTWGTAQTLGQHLLDAALEASTATHHAKAAEAESSSRALAKAVQYEQSVEHERNLMARAEATKADSK